MENTQELYMTDIFEDENAYDLDYDMTIESKLNEQLDYSEGINELVSLYA